MESAFPERTCIGCRRKTSRDELLKAVAGKEGKIIPDLNFKLPGRGAYFCPSVSCIKRAFRGKRLEKILGKPVSVPEIDEFLSVLRAGLNKKLKSLIGISMKAGQVVSGRETLVTSLKRGEICLLLLSSNIAGSTEAELVKHAVPQVEIAETEFDSFQLGHMIGKDKRSSLGIRNKKLAKITLNALRFRKSLM